ncbi:hypothetical protein HNP84_001997 [Thermocatellispora tengchongensis]|uniref:Uncharacterized protein n=1 Tax=Thermocatellispora tengchongensis TaxID=1073253 RepID=A0A840P332_9ACTN|nr:hypothetical protein [Thermocatellispora tengchongensis]MBB5132281.1 hypothetical protein [Thermocatellispora tengchongensis]
MTDDRVGGTDVMWLLTHGAGMAWQYAMAVQTALTDIDAAIAAEDYPVAVEACAVALRAMAYCEQVGEGYTGRPTHVEHHVHLAVDGSPAALALRRLPPPCGATAEQAQEARTTVLAENERLRARLPLTIPVMRTANGFFPIMGIAGALEKLRAESGLGAMDWDQWGI